jgi:hypothetical protein
LFDGSEFGDIFDVEHFKTSLKDDVRIVSALPSRLLMYRPTDEKNIPLNASPRWLRAHYAKKMSQDGVLLLRSLDSRLTKDLPSDLQKLRCKVRKNITSALLLFLKFLFFPCCEVSSFF